MRSVPEALPTRQVGTTELHLPILSVGCSPLGELWDDVEPEDALRALRVASEVGFLHYDTAPWYGNGMSEARVGMALNAGAKKRMPLGEASGDSAQRVGRATVSTKIGRALDPAPRGRDGVWDGPWHGGYDLKVRYDFTYHGVLQQHRESCLRMGLPRVDALAIHDLDGMFGGQEVVTRYLQELTASTPQGTEPGKGGLHALWELKEQGHIKAVGIGCNSYEFGSKEVCERVMMCGLGVDYIILAGPYNLLNQEALDDILPMCREKNVSVLVGAPFASGILAVGSGKLAGGQCSDGASRARAARAPSYMYAPASESIIDKVAAIETVCHEYSVTLPAVALQFPLFHPRVASVLSGIKSEEEVRQAIAGIREPIPVEFWKELKKQGLIRQDAPIAGDDTQHL